MSDDESMDDYYDEDEDEDSAEYLDEDGFDAPQVEQSEAAYEVLDAAQCLELAQAQVRELSELLCCESETAEWLLRDFKWDREKLTEEYMLDPEATVKKLGINLGSDQSVIHQGKGKPVLVGGSPQPASAQPAVQCLICFDSTNEYSALACGHHYCNECYTSYVAHKVSDEGFDCIRATCPDTKCPLRMTKQLATSLLADDEERLKQFDNAASIARSFVDDQPGLKWCPAPDCGSAVRLLRPSQAPLGVKCSCSHRFCFKCSQEDHTPCSCEDLQKWLVKCRDDSETYNWLVSNTKDCPKCLTSIEKNGGCNHMTCKNGACKHEFCWVCMGPWKDHNGSFYNCNKFDPEAESASETGKKKSESRAALARYLHYHTRFTNHHNSLKFELANKEKMEAKIKEMEQLGDNTWMDCLYLMEANEALNECRYALKYTYVFAYYLEGGNFREHFEMQQMMLEQQTEDLSEQLEREVDKIMRMDVVHCFQMAKKRLRNLLELVEAREQHEKGGGGSTSSS